MSQIHTVPTDVFCIFVQYMDLKNSLPCYCHLTHLCLHFITKPSLFSTAQYQDHLFGHIKHSSNSFWLFRSESLMGHPLLENRNLLEGEDKDVLGGSRELMPLKHFIRFFSLWPPSCVLLCLASLLHDSHIKSEILLLGHLQRDGGCTC